MLRKETYAGTLWHNRWQGQKVAGKPGQKPKTRVVELPKEEQIPVAVPSIVPREVYDAAQERLDENLRVARRNTKRDYLLSGLLRHACGSSMGGRTHKEIAYYRCYKDRKSTAPIDERGEPKPCSCSWVNGRALEATIWDKVTGLVMQPELLVQELERLTQPTSTTREALEEEVACIRKRLDAVPQEEQRLVQGYRKGLYADFMMREEMDRLHRERDAAMESGKELELQPRQR